MSMCNGCGVCGSDFTGLSLFDAHRVGKHAYDFGPEHPDGRRCLSIEEMKAKGWKLDPRGRWSDPAAAQVVRNRFENGARNTSRNVDGDATVDVFTDVLVAA
jgi:hypothetical protein